MSDQYLKPEVHIVLTEVPGVDGVGTAIRLTQIEADLSTMLGRPVITQLDDIPDVDVSGAADGDVILYDDDSGLFVAGPSVNGLSEVFTQSGGGWTLVDGPVPRLYFRHGVRATLVSGVGVVIEPVFGNTSTTVASGDHVHTNPLPIFEPFAASGYMSGGSRTVVSRSVTLAAGISYVVVARFRPQMRGADAGAAYYTMTTTINGNAKTSPGGSASGFWCVQGVPNKEEWVHAQTIVGTGSAINVSGSVAYYTGSGFYVDGGELEIDLRPAR